MTLTLGGARVEAEAGRGLEGGDQIVDLLTQDNPGDDGLGLDPEDPLVLEGFLQTEAGLSSEIQREGGLHPLKRDQSRGREEANQPLGRSN